VDSVEEIVTAVYSKNLRRNLRAAAGRNVRTHLDKLTEEGRVEQSEATFKMAAGKMAKG